MAVTILVNSLPSPYDQVVAAAVRAAIGRRPEIEDWLVSLLPREKQPGCLIQIEDPRGRIHRWHFDGCGDEPVKDTIRYDLFIQGIDLRPQPGRSLRP